MKKQLSLFVATFATLFITLSASAQGEWKWAHYWTGGDGSYGDYYNKIINTAFDDDGNIYVYGTMGGSPKYDENTLQFTTNAQVLNSNKRTILLAKFDTLGNMLWYKIVKSSGSQAIPRWMEVRDNQIHISGDVQMEYVDYNWNSVWLYYLDTLIRGAQVHAIPVENRRPPYMTGYWTFFATLDTDGELIHDHFVKILSRDFLGGARFVIPLCHNAGDNPTPVHTDSQGDIYVFTPFEYRGRESDPLTIEVDGDSNKTYNLFLPGSVDSNLTGAAVKNALFCKFSPSGELLSHKLLVDHTDGIASNYQYNGDSINKYYDCSYTGMSYDEEDNMYLSGYVRLGLYASDYGGNLHQYPVYIWWDSTHHSVIKDITSAMYCNFAIKYNTNGEICWSNQIHTEKNTETANASAFWNGCAIKDNSLYILGNGYYTDGALVYFDSLDNYLQRFQSAPSDIAFFVRYDKMTGQYLNHGIVPAAQAVHGRLPAIINNRVFSYSNVNFNNRIISQWRTDGVYIGSETISSQMPPGDGSLMAKEDGHLLLNFTANAPVTFGNNIFADCPSGPSSAVVAFYHNPEFAQPFVPDDSVGIDEYYQNREREIYLYPNPTDGRTTVCGYMYGYRSIELLDLQGRKLATLLDSPHGTDVPEIDLSPYPAGTYLVKINFERGVSVVRKVVRM